MIIALANATTIYVSLPTEDKIFDSILHLFSIREASINTIKVPDTAPNWRDVIPCHIQAIKQ